MRNGLSLLLALFVCAGMDVAYGQQRLITAYDLATLQDIDALSISPDGRWAALQVRRADPATNRYVQSWNLISTSGGALRRLSDGGEAILYISGGISNGNVLAPAPVWSPDGQWLAYLRADDGRTQIWRSRVCDGSAEQLTRNAGDVDALAYSKDGRRLYFTARVSPAEISAALKQEERSGFRFDERFAPTLGSRPLVFPDLAVAAAARIWTYDVALRRERRATDAEAAEYAALTEKPPPQDGKNVHGMPVAAPSGAVAWLEARDPKLQGITPPLTVVAQLPGAAPVICPAAECTSQRISPMWWRNATELIFLDRGGRGVRDSRQLYAWRPGESTVRLILNTQDVFPWPVEQCAVAQDRLVCFYEEHDRPRRLVAVNLDDGKIETLFDPNPEWIRFDLGPKPQFVHLRSPSGPETFGYLALPPGHKRGERLPLIIVTYRCNDFMRGGTGDEYPVFPFAAQGFAVLCYNVLWDDFERQAYMPRMEFESWFRGPGDPGRRRVQEGLDTAVAELDRMGIVDLKRIGVTGLSFGADTTKYALFNMPLLTAAIASSTPMEPADAFLAMPRAHETIREWGLDSPTSKRWETLSLARNAERARAPFLINVPDSEMLGTLETVTALQRAGRAVELYVFAGEYHIKSQPAHRLAIYQRNIDWMNFWLRGVDSGMTGDAGQYVRWRAMRENQCKLFGPKGAEHASNGASPWYCNPGMPQG